MVDKAQTNDKKKDEQKGPQYKQERHLSIKHGLDHTKEAKTNGRKIVNGYECVQFERKDRISAEQLAQSTAVPHPRATMPCSGSAAVKGGSAHLLALGGALPIWRGGGGGSGGPRILEQGMPMREKIVKNRNFKTLIILYMYIPL